MTGALERVREFFRGDAVMRLIAIGALFAVAIVLGQQYMDPNKRVLAVLAALVLFGVAWRIDMIAGIGILFLALPYPRSNVIGNSNLALILLLSIIWLLRHTQRQSAPPRSTPVDVPVAALFVSYVVSFYNINNTADLFFATQYLLIFGGCLAMFYMVVSNVRTSADLKRLHYFQIGSLTSVMLLAIFELNNPGGAFIPGWIEFTKTVGTEFNTRNVRVGGPFFDYELLSEYCALNLLFMIFQLARAKSMTRRVLFSGITLLTAFILFSTLTRGAVIALGIGLAYLIWITRRHIRVVPATITVVVFVTGFLMMNFYVANFTNSGDLLARLMGTEFVGFVPDSRVNVWQSGWDRFLEHPLIGRGPYYSTREGLVTHYLPHNLYLFIASTLGAVGLTFFLWLMYKLIRMSKPVVDTLRHPSYAKSFLVVAHVQLIVFLIDQVKIEYLRDEIYQFQVWIMFSTIVAAWLVARREDAEGGSAPK